MAELTKLYLEELSEENEACWLAEMDDAARKRAEETGSSLRRRQRIAGDHLVREAVGRLRGAAPGEVRILREPSGKPYAEGCCFSLSHSDSLVVCAAGADPLGVDAERLRPYDARIAERYFSAAEQAALAAAGGDEVAFWQIWTGKEALVKLSGEGLAGLKRADSCAPPPGVTLLWERMGDYLVAVAERSWKADG